MVQAFSKLQRINQRLAGPVIAVQFFKVRAGYQKSGYPTAIVSDPDFVQTCAHAKQKCALKQVGHFKGSVQKDLTSFQLIDFFGEMRY